MAFVVLSGCILCLLLLLFGGLLRDRFSALYALLPAGLFVYFLNFLPTIQAGRIIRFHYSWVPSLGIDFDFKVDGLSLLFSLLITGVGALIFLYASAYMKGHPFAHRFYAYLSVFMAAMLGLVLSDNLLLVFLFWELTSISSFFLIGFNNEEAASRKSAMLALIITGGGGYLLLAGFILIGHAGGTLSLHELTRSGGSLQTHALYPLMAILLFAGAFTKSAQFPFHFWLPGAMKAPTPVSAYLHSATMVKAGIYLLARFSPILGGVALWQYTLLAAGGITMLYGAIHALFRVDLKGILAYSTISALGMLVFLLGIGTNYALIAAATFILVHALYKAALFLITGILDHETGTRDITKLTGLGSVMVPVFVAGILAALSSAGMPLTFGFIGKDLIYEATLHATVLHPMLLTGIALLTNILLVYAGFLAGIRPFTGKLPDTYKNLHLPAKRLWMTPLLLGIFGLFFGIFPDIPGFILLKHTAISMQPGAVIAPLKIWHGLNTVLLLSGITLVAGILIYLILKPSEKKLEFVDSFKHMAPETFFYAIAGKAKKLAFRYTRMLHNGYLRFYLRTIIIFLTLLVGYRLLRDVPLAIDTSRLSAIRLYEVVFFCIMVITIFITVFSLSRLTAIIGMSVIGYCICLIFVFYGAPDLAMTQFTIDTLTVVLFVLVLFKLPSFMKLTNNKVKIRDGIISLSFGVLIALIALQAFNISVDKNVSHYYAENAYKLARGKNVVNVILVDFRGTDTMVEIIVLTIAGLGVYSLLKLNVHPDEKE